MTDLKIKELSVKSFISDLPRIFNQNFKTVKDFIDNIYDSSTNSLTAKNIRIDGAASCNSVTAKNIYIVDGNKKTSIADLIKRLEKLEQNSSN